MTKIFFIFSVSLLFATACAQVQPGASEVTHEAAAVSSASCTYNGQTYQVGAVFPATDGINQCDCQNGGEVACTLVGQ